MEKGEMEMEKKRRKIVKGKEVENWKMERGKSSKIRRGLFFFFFFLLFTFKNDKNLFWVYQNGNFLPGKSISRREKNQENWLRPLRKIFLLRPCLLHPKCCFWEMSSLSTTVMMTMVDDAVDNAFDKRHHCQPWLTMVMLPRGITGIFFRLGKVIFPDFFLAWNVFSR